MNRMSVKSGVSSTVVQRILDRYRAKKIITFHFSWPPRQLGFTLHSEIVHVQETGLSDSFSVSFPSTTNSLEDRMESEGRVTVGHNAS